MGLYQQGKTHVRGIGVVASESDEGSLRRWEAEEAVAYQSCGHRISKGKHGVTSVAHDASRQGEPALDYLLGECVNE